MSALCDDDLFYRELSQRLRVVRKTLGLNESKAASAAGVTLRTWRKLEAGQPTKSSWYLMLFCEELEVSFGCLCTGKDPFLDDTEYEKFARYYPKGILTDAGVSFRGITVRH